MKKIDEFKVSLMEKDADFEIDDKGKGNYIIRTSGTFNAKEFFSDKEEPDGGEYREFIEGAILAVYENLPIDAEYDSIGIWITFSDGQKIDNSVDLATINSMEDFGVIKSGMLEFIKMTLDAVNDESEESQ